MNKNKKLIALVEAYMRDKEFQKNELVKESAEAMCDIALSCMWAITQEWS